MTVVTSSKSTDAKKEQSKTRYVVEISVSTLDSAMRQLINKEAPGKIISRSGGNYAVGMFAERGEADALVTALIEAYPTLEMSITETEME